MRRAVLPLRHELDGLRRLLEGIRVSSCLEGHVPVLPRPLRGRDQRLRDLQRRAERRGEPGLLVHTHSATAAIHFLAGRWDDAIPEIEAAMAVARESGAHGLTLVGHALQARIALGRGDFPSADAHLAAGHQLIEAGRHLFGVDLLLWTQARMLEARGESGAALYSPGTPDSSRTRTEGYSELGHAGPLPDRSLDVQVKV